MTHEQTNAGMIFGPDESESAAAHRFHAAELERHIGERLRFVRRVSCLSQRQVADEIGLSSQQVQKYENGTNRVSAALLAELSGLFRLPMDWFIGPFNTCLERDEHVPSRGFPYVLDRLYCALNDRSDGEFDAALDLVCRVAGVGARPQPTRLLRLRRAMRDCDERSRDVLIEVVQRLADLRDRTTSGPARAAAPPKAAGEDGTARNVLLVDDDPDVLTTLSASLASAGFSVTTATTGDEAVSVLASETRVDVIVTDYAMAGMDGIELLAQAGQLRPGLPGIVITGFADAGRLHDLPPEVEVLSKPFRRMELIGRVRLLVESSRTLAIPLPVSCELTLTA